MQNLAVEVGQQLIGFLLTALAVTIDFSDDVAELLNFIEQWSHSLRRQERIVLAKQKLNSFRMKALNPTVATL